MIRLTAIPIQEDSYCGPEKTAQGQAHSQAKYTGKIYLLPDKIRADRHVLLVNHRQEAEQAGEVGRILRIIQIKSDPCTAQAKMKTAKEFFQSLPEKFQALLALFLADKAENTSYLLCRILSFA